MCRPHIPFVDRNSYIAFSVDPGEHHLCTNWQSHFKRLSREAAFTGFTAEEGKTYYFRSRITFSSQWANEYLDLDAVDPDEGQYLVVSSQPVMSHPKK